MGSAPRSRDWNLTIQLNSTGLDQCFDQFSTGGCHSRDTCELRAPSDKTYGNRGHPLTANTALRTRRETNGPTNERWDKRCNGKASWLQRRESFLRIKNIRQEGSAVSEIADCRGLSLLTDGLPSKNFQILSSRYFRVIISEDTRRYVPEYQVSLNTRPDPSDLPEER